MEKQSNTLSAMAKQTTGSTKPAHRRPDMPHRDAPKGQCKWCGDFIWRTKDGTETLDLRKNWHAHCVDAYKEAAWPGYARRKIYRRDKGKCARCGVTARKNWHLDHIMPLVDGGSFTPDNMQTLCPGCHRLKTAAEATARAERRRQGVELSAPPLAEPEYFPDEFEDPSYFEAPDF